MKLRERNVLLDTIVLALQRLLLLPMVRLEENARQATTVLSNLLRRHHVMAALLKQDPDLTSARIVQKAFTVLLARKNQQSVRMDIVLLRVRLLPYARMELTDRLISLR